MKSVAIYGGSFNPIHLGHISSLKSIKKHFEFDEIKIIPSYLSPNKEKNHGNISNDERVNLIKLALEENELDKIVFIDTLELERKGVSYTIDTVNALKAENKLTDYTLVIGLDQFIQFHTWKDYEKILNEVNLIVTSRGGHAFPESHIHWNSLISDLVEDFEGSEFLLTTGKKITFFNLDKNYSVSSSTIRKKIFMGQNVSAYMSEKVCTKVLEKKYYDNEDLERENFIEMIQTIAQIIYDKKGMDIKAYDVSKLNQPSDYVIIASGTSTKHTQALADAIVRNIKKSYFINPFHEEGTKEGRWSVLDYGNLIVHLFYDYTRMEYRLEQLWENSEPISLVLEK